VSRKTTAKRSIFDTPHGKKLKEMGIQGKEWLWILLAIIILFGAKKIPDLMKGIGQGVKEFKNASKGESTEGKEKSETK
jgi:sec-independent protein translocase protein TatA